MLALKLLLTVAGALLLSVALAIPLIHLINRLRRMRQNSGGTEKSVSETADIPWRGAVALALVACLPLLIASSIAVIPSGMGAVRISQIRGTLPGTLYPGTHFITPLVETVQTFDLRDHLYTAGFNEGGSKPGTQKDSLNVQSREGLNIGLGLTVRYRLDPGKLDSVQAHLPQPADKELVPPVVASAWRELTPQYTVREIFSTKREEVRAKASTIITRKLAADGNVVSSAQWPARFGYPEPAATETVQTPFLKREELSDGSTALGLFAVRVVRGAEPAVHLVGGKRLDQSFLADLPVAQGMHVYLYTDAGPNANPDAGEGGAGGEVTGAAGYQFLIETARRTGQQTNGIVSLTSKREDSVNATAIPLKNETGRVLAVLTVAISRAGMVQAQEQIRAMAYGVATVGILIAIAVSLWIAARVSRPIEQLASAAEEVAGGNWEVQVPEGGHDEVGVLARSFNHMTSQLTTQRDRLIQTERVAAWRELARRLAHELKNPLFPLQLTVENLMRARELSPAEFDEVFRESTHTLGMEIANLKTIIGRFSDFSKMPKPELDFIDAKDIIKRVRALYDTSAQDFARVRFEVELVAEPMPLNVDSELLHRAMSNLVLNAMDAMPEGGTLLLSARPAGDQIEIRVADTGEGLTKEECERLFTPYYTTKQHGTGLGLAIVQSIVADHAGKIAVESRIGEGATFVITLPRADA